MTIQLPYSIIKVINTLTDKKTNITFVNHLKLMALIITHLHEVCLGSVSALDNNKFFY